MSILPNFPRWHMLGQAGDTADFPLYDDSPHRIYADNNGFISALVDDEDYHYLIKWCWCWKRSRGPAGKLYLRRAVGENANGQRLRTWTEYMHVAIMQRVRPPPTPFHTLVDHRDGDSLNCRRYNLRWATPSMNRRNLYGAMPHDFLETAHVEELRPQGLHAG